MKAIVLRLTFIASLFFVIGILSCNSQNKITSKTFNMNYKKLTPEESRVILNKGTEAPFIGEYTDHFENHYTNARIDLTGVERLSLWVVA